MTAEKILSFLQSYLRRKLVLRLWRRQWVRKFRPWKDFAFSPWSHGNETSSKLKITWMKLLTLTQSSHESRVWTQCCDSMFQCCNDVENSTVTLNLSQFSHFQRKFAKFGKKSTRIKFTFSDELVDIFTLHLSYFPLFTTQHLSYLGFLFLLVACFSATLIEFHTEEMKIGKTKLTSSTTPLLQPKSPSIYSLIYSNFQG